jgi:hypothetical protein
MPFAVHCPDCSVRLNVPDSAVGKSFKCPKCQGRVIVPEPEPVAASHGDDALVEYEVEPRKKNKKKDDGPGVMRYAVGGVVLVVCFAAAGYVWSARSKATDGATANEPAPNPPRGGATQPRLMPQPPDLPIDGWEEFSPPGSGFKGLFPNEPVKGKGGTAGVRYRTEPRAASGGVTATVDIFYPVPGGKSLDQIEAEFAKVINQPTAEGGMSRLTQPTTLSGKPATEHVVTRTDASNGLLDALVIRVLKTDTSLVMLALSSTGAPLSAAAQRMFFDSFRLLATDSPTVAVPAGWVRVAPLNGGFQTYMPPSSVGDQALTIPREFTKPRSGVYVSDYRNGKTWCAVYVIVFPVSVPVPEREKYATKFAFDSSPAAPARVKSTLGGIEALEQVQEASAKSGKAVVRYAHVGDRAYIARITPGDPLTADEEVRAFFGNFTLTPSSDTQPTGPPPPYVVAKRFQVRFPDNPILDIRFNDELKRRGLNGSLVQLRTDLEVIYHILHYDTPVGVSAADKQKNDRDLAEGRGLAPFGSHAGETKKVKMAGKDWDEVTYVDRPANGKVPTYVVRRIEVNGTTYVAAVTSYEGPPPAPAVKEFFDSFQFLE